MIDLVIPGLRFRPIKPADEPLLSAIYASTRTEELARVTEWTEEQKRTFLQQQFQAQHTYYGQVYQDAQFMVIFVENQPAGRLYLNHWPKDLRIVDITLLPAFRGHGWGERILRAIQAEAQTQGKTVSIHVERMNPALHLYQRLGFQVASEENQVYLLMRWQPETTIS